MSFEHRIARVTLVLACILPVFSIMVLMVGEANDLSDQVMMFVVPVSFVIMLFIWILKNQGLCSTESYGVHDLSNGQGSQPRKKNVSVISIQYGG
jgi:hypothetical protein